MPDPFLPVKRSALIVLTMVCLAGLGFTGWRGWREYRAWATAIEIKGTLAEISTSKGAKHPLYRVAFIAPSGRSSTALLTDADFYISPKNIGEEVDLRCVLEDPPRVHGPSRGDDPAMTASLLFMPWALGIVFFWFIVKMRLSAASWRQFFFELVIAIFTNPARRRREPNTV